MQLRNLSESCVLQGVELFMATDYDGALQVFGKSLKKPENKNFEARALYWQAESAFQLNRYEAARDGFLAFKNSKQAKNTNEFNEVDYNLGYCYFKLKDYAKAIPFFKANTTVLDVDKAKVADSYMRLGDSYFVTSDYKKAITAYDRAATFTGPEKDYAVFQKAISQGFLGNNEKKIKGLNQFVNQYPNSSYKDDALFELGNTYVKADNGTKGLQIYDALIAEYPKSKFAPRAMLRQGLVYYNDNNNQRSLEKFKMVVRNYPSTPEANQAVAQAKLVYVDMGRVSEYADWVKGLDFVEVSDAELEAASFEAAERKYIEGNTDAAIRGYEDYLKQFANGPSALKAHFNLAQLYFSKNNKDAALGHFIIVAQTDGSEYTEKALTRVAEIYGSQNNFEEAKPYLLKLESVAEIPQNKTYAQSNLMKGFYEQKSYAKTIEYAEKVLKAPNLDKRIKSDAQLMIARSAIKTDNEDLAEATFAEVLKIASGKDAAEAWYYDAYFKNKAQNYEASNESVQKLAKDYSAYKEWGGKGLVLMAKNFYALGDAFQATYILESVIENFSDFEAIVAEAKGELALIKSREAKTNSSILPDGQ